MIQQRESPRPAIVVQAPRAREPERRYVLDVVVRGWLGLEYELDATSREDVVVRLAGDADERALRMPDVLLAAKQTDWLTERSLPRLPLVVTPPGLGDAKRATAPLPVLFGRDASPTPEGSEVWLPIDVFGSIFFLITGYEDAVDRRRDQHDRATGSLSVLGRAGLLDRALADEYLELLWATMGSLWPSLRRVAGTYRLRPTHDVDHVWAAVDRPLGTVLHAVAGDLVRRRDLRLAWRRTRSLVAGRAGGIIDDPFDSFETLLSVAQEHDLTSTYYFMVGGTGARLDGSYEIGDRRVLRLLARIHERGHEVGLHASYGSHRAPGQASQELDLLRQACRAAGFDQDSWGIRQHYLRFTARDTWRCQTEAGFEHDSSYAYADRIGFRAGTGREYPVFDLERRRPLRLRERPLLIMDATLLEYLRLPPSEAVRQAQLILGVCQAHQTDATVLYHNSTLTGPAERRRYRELIALSVGPQEQPPA